MATKMWNFIRNKTHHQDQEVRQKGAKELLLFKKTLQHGFPNRPSALAYDPKLKIFAIGTRSGAVKIHGAAGVECYAQHDTDTAISHIVFLPNQARFVTVCEDNRFHLWELNSRDNKTCAEQVNSATLEGRLKKVSAVCLSSFYDQLYVGTEGGNVYVLNIGSFEFIEASVIYVEAVSQNTGKSHIPPGAVEAIAAHPSDSDQLCIGYNKGLIVLWDLKEKCSVQSYWAGQQIESVCWINDGSRFVSSHNDGSYSVWDSNQPKDPVEKPPIVYGPYPCKPIPKLLWRTVSAGGGGVSQEPQPFIIFSGGMPRSQYGDHHTVTVIQGDRHVAYDFTSRVVDFFTINKATRDKDDPEALIVLLEEELIAIDLVTEKWPIYQLPYLFVIHSSSITASHHVSNVSEEVRQSVMAAGRIQKHLHHYSPRPWPISGGECFNDPPKVSELLLTGHEDGSVRFWDVSGPSLTLLYRLTTGNLFRTDDGDFNETEDGQEVEEDEAEEWPPFRKVGCFDPYSDDPRLAVQKLDFCPKSSTVIVAGTSGQVIVFEYKSVSNLGRTVDLTGNLVGDRDGFVWKGHGALKLKGTVIKSDIGFQPQLVVQIMPPAACTALTWQSDWHIFGAGTAHGFVLVDYLRRKVVTTRCTLNASDVATGTDATMTRRKSFKKSLRESFRRIRRGRSQMEPKRNAAGDRLNPGTEGVDTGSSLLETRPVERQIEARTVDNEMGSVVRCLQLVSCFMLNNVVNSPTFWAGTNSGTVLIYTLVLPLSDNRKEEDVHASLSKEIQLRHHAPVVHIAVVDAQGCPLNEKIMSKDNSGDGSVQKVVICSEEQFKIFHLPSLKPYTKYKLTAHEGTLVRKIRIVKFTSKFDDDLSEYCLACLSNQGDISIFNLPNLTRLLKVDCVKKEDIHGISTLIFTKSGQGFYQKSPSEFQRFTLSARDVVEPLCMLDIPDNARPNNSLRPPNSPVSRISASSRNQSPHLTSHKSSPESGISVNNVGYSRAVGVRSPDTLNLNESMRSETSGEVSIDNIRVFSGDGRISSASPGQRLTENHNNHSKSSS